ncbi:MAG: hypothetical protein AAGM22_08095 [Acidobacteriota bacterium]
MDIASRHAEAKRPRQTWLVFFERMSEPMVRELHSDCPSCGSAMHFAAAVRALKCRHCGHQLAVDSEPGEDIRRFDFEAALSKPDRLRSFDEIFPAGHEVECERCGGRSVLHRQSGHCPYCGSPILHEVEAPDVLSPDSILPFKLTQDQAMEALESWLQPCRLSETELATALADATIEGVYLPYWAFTWRSTSFYRGRSGDPSPWSEKRIDWNQTGGAVRLEFQDVVVGASGQADWYPIDWGRWGREALRPYDPAFLQGFAAQRYNRDLKTSFRQAVRSRDTDIQSAVRADIFGEFAEVETVETVSEEIQFRHCLLPAWIVNYSVGGYTYRAVIDGDFGEVHGERPALPEGRRSTRPPFDGVVIPLTLVAFLLYLSISGC